MKENHKPGGFLFAVKAALGGALGFEIFGYLGLAYLGLTNSSFARELNAGSTVIFALLIAGFLNLLTMLSYCELSAILPEEGGEYIYAKAAFGGFAGFIIGCLRWFSSVIGGALAAVILSEQIRGIFSLQIVNNMGVLPEPISWQILGLFIIITVIVFLTILSIRGGKKFDVLIICVILGVFSLFIIMGFMQLEDQMLPASKLLPEPTVALSGPFLLATAFLLQPFLGMRAIVASVPKMKEPEKNVLRAVILSTILLILIYCGLAYIAASVLPLAPDDYLLFLPLAANIIIPKIGSLLIIIVGIVVCVSGISSSLVVQSSILCGMSKDEYLPKILSLAHLKFDTYHIAIIASSLFMVAFAVLEVIFNIDFLVYATALSNILVFAFVNLAVIGLRRKELHIVRPFKTPLYPLTPIAGILVSLGLLVSTYLQPEIKAINMVSGLKAIGVLLSVVFLSYYLKMVGRNRLKVAVGGIGLGLGALGTALSYLVYIYPDWLLADVISKSSTFYVLFFISIISLIAGIMNICTGFSEDQPSYRVGSTMRSRLIRNTISEEKLRFRRISNKIGRYLSGLPMVTGLLLSLLSFWSIQTSEPLFKDFSAIVLGLAGIINIVFGMLLIEK